MAFPLRLTNTGRYDRLETTGIEKLQSRDENSFSDVQLHLCFIKLQVEVKLPTSRLVYRRTNVSTFLVFGFRRVAARALLYLKFELSTFTQRRCLLMTVGINAETTSRSDGLIYSRSIKVAECIAAPLGVCTYLKILNCLYLTRISVTDRARLSRSLLNPMIVIRFDDNNHKSVVNRKYIVGPGFDGVPTSNPDPCPLLELYFGCNIHSVPTPGIDFNSGHLVNNYEPGLITDTIHEFELALDSIPIKLYHIDSAHDARTARRRRRRLGFLLDVQKCVFTLELGPFSPWLNVFWRLAIRIFVCLYASYTSRNTSDLTGDNGGATG
ncbi:hypothetical protein EVAR_24047_1 [Eumeta japonica]|uniref:Uncharacterized protein n=1 Tax=Eumeta variegata TaxID=151549 RepID=A0A4C1VTP3_EUMVA|nr:hypothetical protein EVAR_24047_1 [Eumeta japonica]